MGVLAACGRVGSIVGQFAFGALISVSVHALLALAAVMLLAGNAPFDNLRLRGWWLYPFVHTRFVVCVVVS